MISDTTLYALAAIGAIVVAIVLVVVLYIGIGILLMLVERAFERAAKFVFFAAGGRAGEEDKPDRAPKPPADRVWIELRWLASVSRWVQTKLGYVNYVNPGERPDIERLHEVREEEKHLWEDESEGTTGEQAQ